MRQIDVPQLPSPFLTKAYLVETAIKTRCNDRHSNSVLSKISEGKSDVSGFTLGPHQVPAVNQKLVHVTSTGPSSGVQTGQNCVNLHVQSALSEEPDEILGSRGLS